LHRGWAVLAAAAIGVFMTVPGQTVGVAPFIDLLARDLGLAREHVILLYSLGTLVGILPAPLIGRLFDRYGPRRMIVLVSVALGASCAAMAGAMGLWSLALAFTLLRGSAIGGLSVTSINMVNLWFERLRGRATAVAMLGLAAGGMLIPPLAEQVTIAYGWRVAYLAFGIAVLAIMLPVGLGFFRDRPQNYGLSPDFGRQQTAGQSPRRDYTLSEAIRTPAFWYLVSLSVLYNAGGTALMLDHIRLMQSVDVPRATAITLLGFVPLAQVLAVMGGGVLVDKLGARHAGFMGVAAMTLSLACVLVAPAFLGGFAYVLFLGVGIGILSVAASAGLAEYFGTRHMGTLRGTIFLFGIFGAALGPLPLAWSPHLAHWTFVTCAGLAVFIGIATRSNANARPPLPPHSNQPTTGQAA
jgi:MFS family permease